MRRLSVLALVVLALLGLAGEGLSVRTAGAAAPARSQAAEFDPTLLAFFEGALHSRGTVTTAFLWTEAFTAEFEGRTANGSLVLDERFTFQSGKARQIWTLSPLEGGGLTGTVRTQLKSGEFAPARPVRGTARPEGLVLAYDGYAPNGGDTLFHFHHAMTRHVDGTVRNAVTVSKYYLPLATSDVTFFKPDLRR